MEHYEKDLLEKEKAEEHAVSEFNDFKKEVEYKTVYFLNEIQENAKDYECEIIDKDIAEIIIEEILEDCNFKKLVLKNMSIKKEL